MTLVLEIEHLLGVAFAARTPASPVPDWPPQPDRIFSALVAAWAARSKRVDERRALEWLESQPPPVLSASGGTARTPATAFVPPNDPETGRSGDPKVLPALRKRQPRRFPAFRPHDPVVRLVWPDAAVDGKTLSALNALATHTPYVGHSASLTRCRFHLDGAPERTAAPRRAVYKGRLAELEHAFDSGRRPEPGEEVGPARPATAAVPGGTFAARWLVLEHVGGEMPDLRAAALVAKALRNVLMSGYKAIGLESAVPAAVSGHAPDGTPTAEPHLAIAPLAFVGPRFADGHVLGFALIPPGDGVLLDDESFLRAFRSIAAWNDREGRRDLKVRCDGFDLTFTPATEGARRSLDPAPYTAAAKTWATCTPIVLDRHLKAKGNAERDREVRALIAQACRNAGLPPPMRFATGGDPAGGDYAVAAGKHAAVGGAPSAYPSAQAPRWTGWRLPQSLASRRLTHAVLEFPEPVRGPVILGAGRFVGLGLCRAFDAGEPGP